MLRLVSHIFLMYHFSSSKISPILIQYRAVVAEESITNTNTKRYQYRYLVLQVKVLVNDTCSKAHSCHPTTLMDGRYLVFSTIQIPILVLLVTFQGYHWQYHYLNLSDTNTCIIIQTSVICTPIHGISG